MQPISTEALAFVREGAPWFIQRMKEAAKSERKNVKRHKVKVSLDEFDDNPMLLYACAWLAWSGSVEMVLCLPHLAEARGEQPVRKKA